LQAKAVSRVAAASSAIVREMEEIMQ